MSQPLVPQLRAAEQALVAQYHAAAALLDGLACGPLDAARQLFVAARQRAAARIQGEREFIAGELAGVLAELDALADELGAGVEANDAAAVVPMTEREEALLRLPAAHQAQAAEEQVTVAACSPVAAAPPATPETEDATEDGEDDEVEPMTVGLDDVQAARVAHMVEALKADPRLSNRELCRRFGGNNGTARHARLLVTMGEGVATC